MLDDFIQRNGFDSTYWIALSGGIDSVVLLHQLVSLRNNYSLKLKAIHINHNLQDSSASWQDFCKNLCAKWQVEFVSYDIQLKQKSNIEESARRARYEVFKKCLVAGDILLTAHHQDDQAETLLLQLLRGAGPKGLSGMPKEKRLGKGLHCRPLLTSTRDDIHTYAKQHKLIWIEDPSNSNVNFARNYLRSDVIPVMKSRWKSFSRILARVADNCRETEVIIREVARADLALVRSHADNIISLTRLAMLSAARQRQVLRFWLRSLGYKVPNQKKLLQLQKDFLSAAPDRFPHTVIGNVELRRHRNLLYVLPCEQTNDEMQIYSWDLISPLQINNMILSAKPIKGRGIKATSANVTVRFRQGGEKCQIKGKTHTQKLKKIFQEKKIPQWERDRIPLIYVGDKLAAAVDYFIADEFAAGKEEMGVEISLISNLPVVSSYP